MHATEIATRWNGLSVPLVFTALVACSAADEQGSNTPSTGGAFGAPFGTGGGATAAVPGAGGATMSSPAGAGGGVVGAGGSPGAAGFVGAGGLPATQPPSAGGIAGGGIGNVAGGASAGAGGQSSGGAPAGGAAGAAGAGVGGAGGAGTDVCANGKMGTDSSSARAGTEYAAVKYTLSTSNEIVDFKMTLAVPKKPASQGTLFIWPGLQSLGGKDPARLGNGILQPVLTWGSSCAPNLPTDLSGWWISGMYVNVSTSAAGPTGCAGGASMNVNVGDALNIDMVLNGTSWKQIVTDVQSSKTVDFSIDLKGQSQNWATWAIEIPVGETVLPAEDVVYTQSVLTFASPVTSCQPSQHGPTDYFAAPELSTDGLHCCYPKVVLRARGVPATTMP